MCRVFSCRELLLTSFALDVDKVITQHTQSYVKEENIYRLMYLNNTTSGFGLK